MSSLAYGSFCATCCNLIPPEAEPLACSACSKPCCWKCAREPAESVSLFNAPAVICVACDAAMDLRGGGKMVPKPPLEQGLQRCRMHPERFLNLFCLTCQVQICCDCFVVQQDHKRHTIDSIEEVVSG